MLLVFVFIGFDTFYDLTIYIYMYIYCVLTASNRQLMGPGRGRLGVGQGENQVGGWVRGRGNLAVLCSITESIR